jgi:hypothetical protein
MGPIGSLETSRRRRSAVPSGSTGSRREDAEWSAAPVLNRAWVAIQPRRRRQRRRQSRQDGELRRQPASLGAVARAAGAEVGKASCRRRLRRLRGVLFTPQPAPVGVKRAAARTLPPPKGGHKPLREAIVRNGPALPFWLAIGQRQPPFPQAADFKRISPRRAGRASRGRFDEVGLYDPRHRLQTRCWATGQA